MKIIYIPIEPLEERYTMQMDIWVKKAFEKHKIPYIRVEGNQLTTRVESGSVLDAEGTNYYKFSQLMKVCQMIKDKTISNNDVIFFGDSWFPGQEAIPYMALLENINLKIYGINWAGSSDDNDFTTPMGFWAKWIEKGWYSFYSKVFVGANNIKTDMVTKDRATKNKVVVTGGPWDTNQVVSMLKKKVTKKENIVIFPHRWDEEKNPQDFLKLAKRFRGKDVKFLVCTSRKEFRSNNKKLIDAFYKEKEEGSNLEIKAGIKKQEYYYLLAKSKVFWSSALQETFGYATLEALTFNCYPVVPNRLSYTDYVPKRYRYDTFEEGVKLVEQALNETKEGNFRNIAKLQDRNLDKMIKIMIK